MAGARSSRAIVAYPGVMAVAVEVARAFAERERLERFETTFVYCPDRLPDSLLGAGARRMLGERGERVLSRRAIAGVPGDRVRRSLRWDLLRMAATRVGAGEVQMDRLWERMLLAFDAGVAKRLRPSVAVVYGFEHACLATLARAAELGVRGVLDMAAPHFSLTDRVLAAEVEAFPELRTEHWIATRPLAETRNRRKQQEFESAALIVANSQFTARSLDGSGVSKDKVRVVPLGAPEIDPSWRAVQPAEPARVLFAGSVSVRKGAHLLLDAWRALRSTRGAELLLAGQWLLPAGLGAALPPNVRVLNWLTRAELRAHYRSATVLVLPSLLDGFGMVLTEALAHGLPVITTSNVGAADLIEEGRNGWVIEPGDVPALTARLEHCIDHPGELRAMREAAEQSAARRPWSVYRAELVDTVYASLDGTAPALRGGASF